MQHPLKKLLGRSYRGGTIHLRTVFGAVIEHEKIRLKRLGIRDK
ncbi:hypothetical protein VII_002929 [Vibrio mimicus MB451]|nr:hypothetical protein VII_002929 [Vibrio mimicus MB451]